MQRPTFYALFILLSLIEVASAVSDPFEHLKIKPGHLKVVSKNSEVCSDGPFKLVGKKTEMAIIVGPVISFPLGDESLGYEGCTEKTEVKYPPKKIVRTHTISGCPKELKKLEQKVEETLSIKGKILTYVRVATESPVTCRFEWVPVEKK